MKKKIITGLLAFILVLSSTSAIAYAQDDGNTRFDFSRIRQLLRNRMQNLQDDDKGEREKRPEYEIPDDFDVTCIETAVQARDDDLAALEEDIFADMQAALSDRTDDVITAWNLDDTDEIKDALKEAKKTYSDAVKEAKKSYREERKEIWSTYKEDMSECVSDDDFEAEEGEDESTF